MSSICSSNICRSSEVFFRKGTGKTHTLIEIIRQLLVPSSNGAGDTSLNPVSGTVERSRASRILVCGASNLSVDNILERLLALPSDSSGEKLRVTRVGHPARVMARRDVLEATLEVQASRTDQAALAKDVKAEIEQTMDLLAGKGKGAKGKRPRGAERKKLWEDIKNLRKE